MVTIQCNKCEGKPDMEVIEVNGYESIHKCSECGCEVLYDLCANY